MHLLTLNRFGGAKRRLLLRGKKTVSDTHSWLKDSVSEEKRAHGEEKTEVERTLPKASRESGSAKTENRGQSIVLLVASCSA